MSTKPLVIYHADCTDGYAAAFAAWLKFRDTAEYLPTQYGDKGIPGLIGGREIYILDFSFPRDIMDLLFENASRVVWLDHHKSAFEMWCGPQVLFVEDTEERSIVLDNSKSGCILAWEHFHPGTGVPPLLQHIDDRDRWQWKMPGSAEIHAGLTSHKPWTFEMWDEWVDCWGDSYNHGTLGWGDVLFDQGAAILNAQYRHIEQMRKQKRKCHIDLRLCAGDAEIFDGFACNSQLHASELGHELATSSSTFGLVWYLSGDNRAKCSFRSNGDYDVSAIAKAFGGGGHKNAAGCEVSVETLMGWLN